MSKPRKYKLSPAALAQRRAASKIAGEKRRKGPRKSVSLRADAADILRDAAKNRGLSKSEVIRRDVKYDPGVHILRSNNVQPVVGGLNGSSKG